MGGFCLQQATRIRDAGVGKWVEGEGVFGRAVAVGGDESGARGIVRVIKRRLKSKQDGYVMDDLRAH